MALPRTGRRSSRGGPRRPIGFEFRGSAVTRKLLLGFAVLIVLAAGAYYRFRHTQTPLEIAYAGNRTVTLQSTTAQVREPITTVSYGDRLEVLQRFQDQVNVRTTTGLTGWVNERDLLSTDVWQKAADLEKRTSTLAIQARGHTKVLTNLRIDAGRDGIRLRQLNKNIPLEVFERRAVDVPTSGATAAQEEPAGEPAQARKEDWWLVRAQTSEKDSVSGWILGRFIELDVPQPLPDYASSAGMRIVSWSELNKVLDAAGKSKSQYLLLGAHGPEGQPCDFSMLRVYTWGKQRQRYETAYVESGVCGKLPVEVKNSSPTGRHEIFIHRPQQWCASSARLRDAPDHRTPGKASRRSEPPEAQKAQALIIAFHRTRFSVTPTRRCDKFISVCPFAHALVLPLVFSRSSPLHLSPGARKPRRKRNRQHRRRRFWNLSLNSG